MRAQRMRRLLAGAWVAIAFAACGGSNKGSSSGTGGVAAGGTGGASVGTGGASVGTGGSGGASPDCASSRAAFEASLPVPVPLAGRYVVQLVNESDATLLAGANAAHRAGEAPQPVLPREGTWVIAPRSVLTIDIPQAWEGTIPVGSVGPVFWARTGCSYDVDHDLAQCETGDCGGVYDCSKAGATPPGPKALAEWTFDDVNHNAAPDISVVDGVNLDMDIVPVGPHSDTPVGPVDPAFWLSPQNLPLTKCGLDLRDGCQTDFQLRREQLTFFVQGSAGASDVVGCFSNCGQYKFQGSALGACPAGYRCPGEPSLTCNPDPVQDPLCYYWKSFCCAVPSGDPQMIYTRSCTDSSQCVQNAGCWDARGKCACIAYDKQPSCPPDVCTNQHAQNAAYQPPFGSCSQVTNATGHPEACIGDDTFHQVMPRGLTWPNDPETYYSDAKAYRIVFAPGGTKVPITPSGPPPMCKDLPAAYGYAAAKQSCAGALAGGAVFAGARTPAEPPGLWDCSIGDGVATHAVLCRW